MGKTRSPREPGQAKGLGSPGSPQRSPGARNPAEPEPGALDSCLSAPRHRLFGAPGGLWPRFEPLRGSEGL